MIIKFNDIYENIFRMSFDKSIYVFLCGGAGKDSIRNTTRDYLSKRGFQILYPENLFIDMLNRNKKINLLALEEFLANNSDVICVICESFGSAVELGAFTQNEDIRPKMIAAIMKKYERKNSFVMLGPIRMLRSQNKESVLTYKPDKTIEFCEELEKAIRKSHRRNSSFIKSSRFDNLSSYIGFLPLIPYFYKSISKKDLIEGFKQFLETKNMLNKDFENYFFSAIKYLLKTRIIKVAMKKNGNENAMNEFYELTPKGYDTVEHTLNNHINKHNKVLHDKIRLGIMKEQFNS